MDFTDTYSDHLAVMAARIEEALEDCGFDSLLIYSGAPQRRYMDDQYYPFQTSPQFLSVAPCFGPHHWLCWRAGETPLLILYREDDFWHSPAPAPAPYWAQHFDIKRVSDPAEARRLIPRFGRVAVLGDCAALASDWSLGVLNPEPLVHRLNWHRAVKTVYEQDCLREASRKAVRGHLAAEKAFRKGLSEQQIFLTFLRASRQLPNEQPYDAIVGLDSNASILHHQVLSGEILPPGQRLSLLIDAGAQVNGYAADISRSYAMRSGMFQDLIEAVDRLQQVLCRSLKPGGSFVDLHLQMHRGIAGILKDFGVLRCAPESAVEQGISSTFIPHGLGHHLGLQVHDLGGHQAAPDGGENKPPSAHPFLRNTRAIEAGHVLTIEPGIYFINRLLQSLRNGPDAGSVNWQVVDDLRPFGGVRIEDNVLVTTEGAENLTRIAFTNAKAL